MVRGLVSRGRRSCRVWAVAALMAVLAQFGVLKAQPLDSYAYNSSAPGFTPLVGATVVYASNPILGGVQTGAVPQSVTLPFPFVFYGTQRSSVWVMHNGWLQFAPTMPSNTGNNQSMTTTNNVDMVAAFWDEFTFYPVGSPSFPITLLPQGPRTVISHQVSGTAPFRKWTVEYLYMVKSISAGSAVEISCQVVFTEDGDIEFKFPFATTTTTVSGLNASIGMAGSVVGTVAQGGVSVGGDNSYDYVPIFNYVCGPIRAANYYESFELASGYAMGWKIQSSTGTSWQWGQPGPAALGPTGGANGTLSGWKTSMVGGYLGGTMTVLQSPRVKASGSRLNFWLNMGTESGVSGGRIEISKNNGAFVPVLHNDTGWLNGAPNTASISALGSGGWSGTVPSTVGQYQRVTLNLNGMSTPGLTGTFGSGQYLQVRFRFASGTATPNLPGWTIDDFRIGSDVVEDVGPIALVSPTTRTGNTAAEAVVVRLRNHGGTLVNSIPVSVTVTGPQGTAPLLLSGTWTGALIPNQETNFALPGSADVSLPSSYALSITTAMLGDGVATNNTYSTTVQSIAKVSTLPYYATLDDANPPNVRLVTAPGLYPGSLQPSANITLTQTTLASEAKNTSEVTNYSSRNGTGGLYLSVSMGQVSSIYIAAAADFHFDLSQYSPATDSLWLSWSRRNFSSISAGPMSGVFASIDGGITWALCLFIMPELTNSNRYWADERVNVSRLFATHNVPFSSNVVLRVQYYGSNSRQTYDDFRLERLDAGLNIADPWPRGDGQETLAAAGGTVQAFELLNTGLTAVSVSALSLGVSGTISPSDIASLVLVDDLDRSRGLSSGDVTLATLTLQGGTATASVPNLTLAAGEFRRLILHASLQPSAAGKTIKTSVMSTSFSTTPSALARGSFPLESLSYSVPPMLRVPYSQGFESDAGRVEGWGVQGKSGSIWQRGAPVPFSTIQGSGLSAAKTGVGVFSTRLTGPPTIGGEFRDLVSPTFSLQGTVDPVVSFWLWIDVEGVAFQISKNGGAFGGAASNDPAWLTGAPHTNVSWNSQSTSGWTDSFSQARTWVKVSLRLGSIITHPLINGITSADTVQFKFSYRCEQHPFDYTGAAIDDFAISEFGSPTPPPAWAPSVAITSNGIAIPDGGTTTVPSGSTVASRNFAITISGSTPTTVQAFVLGAGTGNNILPSLWGSTASATTHSIVPSDGVFNAGGFTHHVLLIISNGSAFIERRFSIQVGAPSLATASLPPVSAEPNDVLTLPLSLAWQGAEPVSGITLQLSYHPGRIRFQSLALATHQSTSLRTTYSDLGGVVSVAVDAGGTSALLTPGVVFQLSVQVLASAPPGGTSIAIQNVRTIHSAGMVLHESSKGTASGAAGQIAISVVPPTMQIYWGELPLSNGGTVSVPYRSSLASVGIRLKATGRPTDQLTISTVMPVNASSAGLVAAEYAGSATATHTLTPATGQFMVPGATYIFVVTAATPAVSDTKTFSIVVGPNSEPVITVRFGAALASPGSTATVPIGTTLASLGINVTAVDADGDLVTLTGGVSNVTTQGFTGSEFSASAVMAVATPTSGAFTVPGAVHVFSIQAIDPLAGSASFSFTIVTRSNALPTVQVLTSTSAIASGSTVAVAHRSLLASLGLRIVVTDSDGDAVSLATTFNGQSPSGIITSQFTMNNAVSGSGVSPTSGLFHAPTAAWTVTLTASDPYASSAPFSFTIQTGANALPTLTVSTSDGPVTLGQVIQVAYGDTLGSLGLAIAADDTTAAAVSVSTTVSNSSLLTGFFASEWSQQAGSLPFVLRPIAGRFATPDVNHVVEITANDGDGGIATLSFTLAVGSNAEPGLTVTSNAEPALAAYGVAPGTNLATLGLGASATNPDPYETLILTVTFSGDPLPGATGVPLSVSSTTGAATLSLPSIILLGPRANHVVTFAATDGAGATTTRVVTIFVAERVQLATTALPDATLGQQYTAKLLAVLGTPPYSFTATNLPEWLNLNASSGILSGTPPRGTQTTTLQLDFMVSDASPLGPQASSATLALEVLPASPIDVGLLAPSVETSVSGATTILDASLGPVRNRVVMVELPFPVTFFGTGYSRVWVSTNGWVSFDDPVGNAHPTNSRTASTAGPRNAVFIFWDQLELTVGSGASITIGTSTTTLTSLTEDSTPNAAATEGSLVISYQNLSVVGSPATSLSGHIVIDPTTGIVQLEYPQAAQNWTGATATIGIRGPFAGQDVDPFGLGSLAGAPPAQGVVFSVPSVAVLVTESLPNAIQYSSYGFNMAAHGGTGPYAWTLTGAPGWLTISPTSGVLSGLPAEGSAGVHIVTVSVQASDGSSDAQKISLTVEPATAPTVPLPASSGSQCSMATGGGSTRLPWVLVVFGLMVGALSLRRRHASESTTFCVPTLHPTCHVGEERDQTCK